MNPKLLTYALYILFLLTACGGRKEKSTGELPLIAVSIEPQRYFVEGIAGDRYRVVTAVPPGSSPETYDPTPKQLANLSQSAAYLRIGYVGFEIAWMDRLKELLPHVNIFDLSRNIDYIYETGQPHGNHSHIGGIEPHVWASTVNARIIAKNTFEALCALDPKHEEDYRIRRDSLMGRINRTDSLVRDLLVRESQAAKAFVIYHPSLSYFARDYGFRQIVIEDGGKEPSISHLRELIRTAIAEKVKVIFVQSQFDSKNAEIIGQETGAKVVSINPLSAHWEEEMLRVARHLANE